MRGRVRAVGPDAIASRSRRLARWLVPFLLAAALHLFGVRAVGTVSVDHARLEQDMRAVLGLLAEEVEAEAARLGRLPERLDALEALPLQDVEYRPLDDRRYRLVLRDPLRSVEFDGRITAGRRQLGGSP